MKHYEMIAYHKEKFRSFTINLCHKVLNIIGLNFTFSAMNHTLIFLADVTAFDRSELTLADNL
uniref:Uncharacterized protein n=1 Tax=Romanomermis culicivorax TaxID=13658 RepID=A0A915KZT9_ROMCU